MPRLADFLRAPKQNITVTGWKNGNVNPASFFLLSKAKKKNYRFGPSYLWRLVTFDCLNYHCRVLILYNEGKSILRSTFGVDIDNDVAVLCCHEYHADHPGWHCHLVREQVEKIEPGVFRTGQYRWPGLKAEHAKTEFGITQNSALSHVASRYGFEAQGELI